MVDKVGRNDPCPCGSGKKYKQCCIHKSKPATHRKLKATVLSGKPAPKKEEGQEASAPGPDLIARTFAKQPQETAEDPFEKKD